MTVGKNEAASLGFDRSLSGLISTHERWLLERVAQRLPFWTLPSHLTLLGLAGSALTALGLVASYLSIHFLWAALCGLFLNWVGDSLDGTLARVRRIERPRFGFFVDHVTDILSQLIIVLGLGLSPLMRLDVALLALIGYLALSTYTFIKLHVTRQMQLSYFGIGPTEIRVLIGTGLAVAALTELPLLWTPYGLFGLFDAVGLLLFVTALAGGAAVFVRDARQLELIDPVRRPIPVEVHMVDLSVAHTHQVNTTADEHPANR